MKRLLSVLLAVILVFSCTLSVSADLVYEPEDNFYTRHADECVLIERSFIASETVYSVNEPGSVIIYGKLDEGDEVYISYTYEDSSGIVWGLISFSEVSGWIPMGYLEVIYDNVSFTEEFGSEFSKETDDLKISQKNLDKLVFWDYPCSESFWEMELRDDSYQDINFSYSYTDENGSVWGYVGYFYGAEGWLCIDSPSDTTVSSVLERENEVLYPNSVLGDDNPAEKGGLSPIWIAVILVAVVCAVTAVLIVVLTRKKKD